MFFANAEIVSHDTRQAVAAAPTPTRRVVVAAEPVTDVDTTTADVLQRLHHDLDAAAGVERHFAEVKDPVKDRLRRYGLLQQLGPDRFHPTLGTAVDTYLTDSGIHWREEDSEPNADPEGR